MAKATGVVQFVKSEVRQSKKPGGKSFQLHSIKMNDEWFNCGFNDPGCFEGDNVEVIYEVTQYGKDVEKDGVTRITGAVSARKADVSEGATAAVPYVDNRQQSIHFQSSRKDAIALAGLAIKHDLLKLPTAQNKKLDAVVAFIHHYTDQFVSDTNSLKTGTGAVLPDSAPAVGDDD